MKHGLSAALTALMVVCGAPLASEQQDLREVRERLQRLRSEMARNEGAHRSAADELRASETAISTANRKLHELRAAVAAANDELTRINADIEQLSADIERNEALLSRLLHNRYTSGASTPLKLLLSGREQSETVRLLTYHGYLARAQGDMIASLREDVARLGTLQGEAERRRDELAALEAEQREEQAALAAQVAERRKVLARISADLQSQRKEIAHAQRDEARLARVVEEIARTQRARAAAAAKARSAKPTPPSRGGKGIARNERVPDASTHAGAFPTLKGRLHLPVRGELTNRFGTPRQDSGLTSKGVFIRARPGEEVRAVAGGEVVYAEWMRGFGNLLILDHGAGYMTIYGNNEAVLKRAGDRVRAGDVIATVGATGGNEIAGLYFEMRHLGQPFDPLSWVSLK